MKKTNSIIKDKTIRLFGQEEKSVYSNTLKFSSSSVWNSLPESFSWLE